MSIFKLPDLGEGLPDAEIVEWHVGVGDWVDLDQKLVSMETAKAVVEVPSPIRGRIVKLYGNPQDIIKTGAPLVEYEVDKSSEPAKAASTSTSGSTINHPNANKEPQSPANNAATVAGKLEISNDIIDESATNFMGNKRKSNEISSSKESNVANIKAAPAIRALANRLNVNLALVHPTGPNGTYRTLDIENAAKDLQLAGPFEPLHGMRRTMAKIMAKSHAEVVPVTIFEDALLMNWKTEGDITVRIIQAIVHACKEEPALNAWFDNRQEARRIFTEVHLGLAIDTEDGLIVPVIKNAENLDANGLRQRVNELKQKAIERTLPVDELKGVTFTLSNFGKFAGRYACPIVVPPTVAILGVGKMREDVVAYQGSPTVCPILPLSLTFDHRAVTGGEATRFLGLVIQSLQR